MNPNHDPHTGEFSSGSGGDAISKGNKEISAHIADLHKQYHRQGIRQALGLGAISSGLVGVGLLTRSPGLVVAGLAGTAVNAVRVLTRPKFEDVPIAAQTGHGQISVFGSSRAYAEHLREQLRNQHANG